MLRTRTPTRDLGASDLDAALALCARNQADNCFAAARLLEGGLTSAGAHVVGVIESGELVSLCYVGANVVPVETSQRTRLVLGDRVRKWHRRAASFLGPAEQVLPLWELVESAWGSVRAVRASQPHLATTTPPSQFGIVADERVRLARPGEVDLVLPAAEHMFTHEIGYPPYRGSHRSYRTLLQRLIDQRHTYVIVERGRVIFKADLGSVALGCAQIQGVWVAPELRGAGLGTTAMAGVVENVLQDVAPMATLYVNHFNVAARATYERIGMQQIGTFATVLM
ncbi:MAG: GNAT family N-acetyltransferase [Nostocoides sp.]|uniref:GNAT family N-acetyltransferase n=1 Tax=Nostocoides sp. TaxID=1917966 RepID=UPI003C7409F0